MIGPKTPEAAAFYVEQGIMTPAAASFLLENRGRVGAFLDRDFDRRLEELQRAYRERPRTKDRIEDTPSIRDLYNKACELRHKNRGMTWEQAAARLLIPYGTWKHWRARFLGLPEEYGTK
jgi:hypothetical protein